MHGTEDAKPVVGRSCTTIISIVVETNREADCSLSVEVRRRGALARFGFGAPTWTTLRAYIALLLVATRKCGWPTPEQRTKQVDEACTPTRDVHRLCSTATPPQGRVCVGQSGLRLLLHLHIHLYDLRSALGRSSTWAAGTQRSRLALGC